MTPETMDEPKTGPARLPMPEHSDIRHVIAVMSGKGGVGKSTVAALAAVSLARAGFKTGVLDADITGPSIPKLFGLSGAPVPVGPGLLPAVTRTGVEVMSLNLLLPHEDDPVIWRGPLIAGAVKQFWTDVIWGDLDYLIVDLPPGTGDAPLTVLQSLPLDGLIVVTSPQDLAAMVVRKAMKMAGLLKVPVLGLVENMTSVRCPDCGREIAVFGPARGGAAFAGTGVRVLGSLPLDPRLAELGDRGAIEEYEVDFLGIIPSLVEGGATKATTGTKGGVLRDEDSRMRSGDDA